MNPRSLVRKGIVLCVGLIALTTLPGAAAPIPDAARQRLETFETLKKKLPQVVSRLANSDSWLLGGDVKVRLIRRIAADEAKVTVVSEVTNNGKRWPSQDEYLTLYLHYFDGAWTTTRFEGSSSEKDFVNKTAYALMLGIDQIGER
jgi:hypothetical protein